MKLKSNEKLKPCPFCGCTESVVRTFSVSSGREYVYCKNCDANVNESAWNRRKREEIYKSALEKIAMTIGD